MRELQKKAKISNHVNQPGDINNMDRKNIMAVEHSLDVGNNNLVMKNNNLARKKNNLAMEKNNLDTENNNLAMENNNMATEAMENNNMAKENKNVSMGYNNRGIYWCLVKVIPSGDLIKEPSPRRRSTLADQSLRSGM